MSSENGVPAESVKLECNENERVKLINIKIIVFPCDSKSCHMGCQWFQSPEYIWPNDECVLFDETIYSQNRCPQCIKEFGE